MAFALELYEAGILTDKDLPGFPSDNEERFFYLLEKLFGEKVLEMFWPMVFIGQPERLARGLRPTIIILLRNMSRSLSN